VAALQQEPGALLSARRYFPGRGLNFIFYYDETFLTAIRYAQFKITFSAKFNGKWDGTLEHIGRPQITNLLMDPFERQWGADGQDHRGHPVPAPEDPAAQLKAKVPASPALRRSPATPERRKM
jgi:hypothetical protein